VRRAQAGLLAKLLESAIARTVLAKLAEYSIGSAFYAVGDVAVMDGVKLARGDVADDPLHDHGAQAGPLTAPHEDDAT
jgi:hypothetical protein